MRFTHGLLSTQWTEMDAGRERLQPRRHVVDNVIKVPVPASCEIFEAEVCDVKRGVVVPDKVIDAIRIERVQGKEGQGAFVQFVIRVVGEECRQAGVLNDEENDEFRALKLH